MKTKLCLSTAFFVLLVCVVDAQDRIELKNPSFEMDSPSWMKVPTNWIDLGAPGMSPVDIQPGFWKVTKPPQDGALYVGMVVRDNNTWEGIGQLLETALLKDSTYKFSLWLCRSETYRSSPITDQQKIVEFDAPTILKIWGFNTITEKEELLAKTAAIQSSKWLKYEFELTPRLGHVNEIDLMAYYAPGHNGENGHLLLDNCSALVKVPK